MVYALIFIFIGTTLATLLGAVCGTFTKKLHKGVISFLVNFCLGAIISLVFMHLFAESLEHTEAYFGDNVGAAVGIVLSIVFASGILFFGLHELLHKLTHHHDEDHNDLEPCHDHCHSTEIFKEKSLVYASFIFLIAIFIHNIPEGFALGILFVEPAGVVPVKGIIFAITLFIHNFIIGFTMCSSFIKANKSNTFSILMTTVSSLPALALGYVGYFVGNAAFNDLFKGIMLAISTGSLIYVLIVELIPQSFVEYKTKYTFIFVLLGIVISILLNLIPAMI